MAKTALLLSGGLDSISLAHWKRPDVAVTIDYGQVCAEAEIRASRQVCAELELQHHVAKLDCSSYGSGDLAGKPKATVAPQSDWWPFRNQLLLTVAGMKMLPMDVASLWLGAVKTDNQHADGTAEFVGRVSELMQMQEGGIKVEAPAIEMTTEELVRCAEVPIEILTWGHSCHTSNWACGRCRGCRKHRMVMEAIGLEPY